MRLLQVINEGPNFSASANVGGIPDDTEETKSKGPNFGNDTPELGAEEETPTEPKKIETLDDLHASFTAEQWFRIAYSLNYPKLKNNPSLVERAAKRWLKYLGPGGWDYTASGYALYSNNITDSKVPVTTYQAIHEYFKEVLEKNKDLDFGAGSGEPSETEIGPQDIAAIAKDLQNALGGPTNDEAKIYDILKKLGNAKNWEALKTAFEKTAKTPLVGRINSRLDIKERQNVYRILKGIGIDEQGLDITQEGVSEFSSLVPGYNDTDLFTKYDTSSDKENARQYLIELFRAFVASGTKQAEIEAWLSRTNTNADDRPLPQEEYRKKMKEDIQKQAEAGGITKKEIDQKFQAMVNFAKARMKIVPN